MAMQEPQQVEQAAPEATGMDESDKSVIAFELELDKNSGKWTFSVEDGDEEGSGGEKECASLDEALKLMAQTCKAAEQQIVGGGNPMDQVRAGYEAA